MKRRFSPRRLSSMARRLDPYLQGSSTIQQRVDPVAPHYVMIAKNAASKSKTQNSKPCHPVSRNALQNLGVLRRGCVRCSYIDVLDYKASHNVILSESEEPSYFKFVQAFRVKYEREPLPSRSAVTNWEVAGCFASLNITACLMR